MLYVRAETCMYSLFSTGVATVHSVANDLDEETVETYLGALMGVARLWGKKLSQSPMERVAFAKLRCATRNQYLCEGCWPLAFEL